MTYLWVKRQVLQSVTKCYKVVNESVETMGSQQRPVWEGLGGDIAQLILKVTQTSQGLGAAETAGRLQRGSTPAGTQN